MQVRLRLSTIGRLVELTKKLIDMGCPVIYEAAFQCHGVLAAIDILLKKEDGWYGYEVKSSTQVHDINITDAALQYWVMSESGVEMKDMSIIHINNEYERNGEIEIHRLFKKESVYPLVLALQDEIGRQVEELKKAAASEVCPEILIGQRCTDPYTCDFKEYCWKDVPEGSILDFGYYHKKAERFRQYHSGVKMITDVKGWEQFKPPYNYIAEAHLNKGIYLDPEPVKQFLCSIQHPIGFLDFETVRFAIPPFDKVSAVRSGTLSILASHN